MNETTPILPFAKRYSADYPRTRPQAGCRYATPDNHQSDGAIFGLPFLRCAMRHNSNHAFVTLLLQNSPCIFRQPSL